MAHHTKKAEIDPTKYAPWLRPTPEEEKRRQSEREEQRRQRDLFEEQRARFTELDEEEARLVRFLASADWRTDHRERITARAELEGVRETINMLPEESRIGKRTSPLSPTEHRRQSDLSNNIQAWRSEIERITKHEIPGLEQKLEQIPSARDLGGWQNFADPSERHFNFLREQIAAKLARIEECEQLIAKVREELERMAAKENSVA